MIPSNLSDLRLRVRPLQHRLFRLWQRALLCLLFAILVHAQGADVLGPKKAIVLRVYFHDRTSVSHYTKAQVEGFYDQLNQLWQHTSYGKISINYVVSDLFQLPGNRSDYIDDLPTGDLSNGSKFGQVLTDAIANSPAGIDWTGVDAVHVLMAETDVTQFHRGQGIGSWNLPRGPGGPTVSMGAAIFSENPGAANDRQNWGRWAHEMGHTFQQAGPAHPSNYNNSFDLMDANYPGQTGVFEKQSTTGFPGWMPPGKYQLFTASSGGGTACLWAMEYDPVTQLNFQAARVEITPSFYYLVSVRRRILGDDLNGADFGGVPGIPDEGVLIEQVSEGADPWVTVKGPSGNRNALWKVGDTYFDSSSGVSISVTSKDLSGDNYCIQVGYSSQAMQPDVMIYPWLSYPNNTWETTDIWIDSPVNGYGVYRYGMVNDITGHSVPNGNGDDPAVGQVNRIYARVRNIGTVPATGVRVTWEITDPPGVGIAGATGWVLIGQVDQNDFPSLASIPAGGYTDVYYNWTPNFAITPAQMAMGHFYFHTCVRVKLDHVPGETVFGNQDGDGEQENISYFEAVPPGMGAPFAGNYGSSYSNSIHLHNRNPWDKRTYYLSYLADVPTDWNVNVNGGALVVDLDPLEIKDLPVTIHQGATANAIGSRFGLEVTAATLKQFTNDLDPSEIHVDYEEQSHVRVDARVCSPTTLRCAVTNTFVISNFFATNITATFTGRLIGADVYAPSNGIYIMAIGLDSQRQFLEPTRQLVAIDTNGGFTGTLTSSNGLMREMVCMYAGTEYLCASSSGFTPLTPVPDTDGDGVPDNIDNAINVPNPNQLDTDGDGYANIIDADFNKDGLVNSLDLGLFKTMFGTTNNPNADFNGDGRVNSLDLGIFKNLFGKAPGASGLRRLELQIAYPVSANALRLVFSEPVDPVTAQNPTNYSTDQGLNIFSASIVSNDTRRVTLTTGIMNGTNMVVDVVRAPGVRDRSGRLISRSESPRFIQGIASIPLLVQPATNTFPFTSRYHGLVASASCSPDGGVPKTIFQKLFGFGFIHEVAGGPSSSIKVVTRRQIPGMDQATTNLPPGMSLHVLWAGGVLRTENGETHLVDSGFMEGALIDPLLTTPTPYSISTAAISESAGHTPFAQGLQGVVVQIVGVTIDSVSAPDDSGARAFTFHDFSGEQASGLALYTVTQPLQVGGGFSYVRGLVHQPRPGQYEVIVELDQHLVP
jgi:hypothetical protein